MTTNLVRSEAPKLPATLCGGAIHFPGDPGYDTARQAWSVNAELRPVAVAFPASTAELSETVTEARAAGLRVAVQGTGHAAGAVGDLSDALLIRTSGMNKVSVDPVRRSVRVQAGVLWQDVVDAVTPHGLTVLHGSAPDVGVVGYTLGGGLGWYARMLGLAAHSVTAATVVTSSGEIVEINEQSHRDLLWALRGGAGGNFAIVAELEFKAYPFDTAYAGMLVWDLSRGEEVLRRWAEWSASAPDAVTTSLRFLRLPPIPLIPEPFRGRNLVMINGAVTDFGAGYQSESEADEAARQILAPLRDLDPELDTFARVPTATLTQLHMEPEGPTAAAVDSALLRELSSAAQAAFLAAVGPQAQTPLLVAEIRQLGGALSRPPAVPSALPGFSAQYNVFACAITPVPESVAPGHAACTALIDAMAPWAGGHYLNFVERTVDTAQSFSAEHYERLRALRFVWDPDEALIASHPIPPALPDYLG